MKNKEITEKYEDFNIKITSTRNLYRIIITTNNYKKVNSIYLNNLFSYIRNILNKEMRNQFRYTCWVLLEENFGDCKGSDFTKEIISAMIENNFCNKYTNHFKISQQKVGDKKFEEKRKIESEELYRKVYCSVANVTEEKVVSMLKITLTKGNYHINFKL